MQSLITVLVVLVFSFTSFAQSSANRIRYYVQLVRATDSSRPPQPGSHPVGAKLAAAFNGPLRWNYYWEVCRRQVDVPLGGKTTLVLNHQRAVEIDLSQPGKRTTTALENGRSLGRSVLPVGEAFTIIGGNRNGKSGWFIVVRRDRPGS